MSTYDDMVAMSTFDDIAAMSPHGDIGVPTLVPDDRVEPGPVDPGAPVDVAAALGHTASDAVHQGHDPLLVQPVTRLSSRQWLVVTSGGRLAPATGIASVVSSSGCDGPYDWVGIESYRGARRTPSARISE
jgi:hypothetical protein